MATAYWIIQGREDGTAGRAPKTESFFVAWFGQAGVAIYEHYFNAYRGAK